MENEYVVYILYSRTFDKTYVGYTKNLISRFYSHNFLSKKGYTLRYRPWEVMHIEFYRTKKEAMRVERFYKSGVGRNKIKSLKSNYLKKG